MRVFFHATIYMPKTCTKSKILTEITGNDTCTERWRSRNQSGTYRGHLTRGKYQGRGKFTWKDGSTYLGQWKDDKFDGRGIFKDIDGSMKSGQWKNRRLNGPGKVMYYTNDRKSKSNRRVESGTYKNGKLNGRCVKQFRTAIYRGQCKNGKMDGRGTLRSKATGASDKGIWKNDKLM